MVEMFLAAEHQEKTKGESGEVARAKEKAIGSFSSGMCVLKVYPGCSATKEKHFREQGANWTNELIRHF